MNVITSLFRKVFFKKRKHERFCVSSGTVVMVTPSKGGTEWKVNLVDISMGGLGFIYEGTPEELKESGFLRMFKESPAKSKIQYETVSDVPAPGCEDSGYRRRGVKFKWMGSLEERELAQFIKENFVACKE